MGSGRAEGEVGAARAERQTVLAPGCWAVVCVAEAAAARLKLGETALPEDRRVSVSTAWA